MVHRRYDIMAIVVLVIGVVGYTSVRSELRLRTTMPVEFFDASHVPAEKRASEERIARAYWKCAVSEIQWRYGYAHRLPEEPVQEFSIPASDFGITDSAIRARYWHKLQAVWGVSDAWERHYEWNSFSLGQSLQSAGQWIELQIRRITGYS